MYWVTLEDWICLKWYGLASSPTSNAYSLSPGDLKMRPKTSARSTLSILSYQNGKVIVQLDWMKRTVQIFSCSTVFPIYFWNHSVFYDTHHAQKGCCPALQRDQYVCRMLYLLTPISSHYCTSPVIWYLKARAYLAVFWSLALDIFQGKVQRVGVWFLVP